MPSLEFDLRRRLESIISQARSVAESGARSALQKCAVDVAEPFAHFGPKEKGIAEPAASGEPTGRRFAERR